MNDGYVVIAVSALTPEILATCYGSSTTYRKSLDGTQALLQYRGTPPAWTTDLTLYSQEDALALGATSTWFTSTNIADAATNAIKASGG